MRRPIEAQTSSPVEAAASTTGRISRSSRAESFLPEVTKESLRMPCSRARAAADSPRVAGTMGKTGAFVVHFEDCEHQRQSSAHLPDLALTIVQKLKTREAHFVVTRCAASTSSSRAGLSSRKSRSARGEASPRRARSTMRLSMAAFRSGWTSDNCSAGRPSGERRLCKRLLTARKGRRPGRTPSLSGLNFRAIRPRRQGVRRRGCRPCGWRRRTVRARRVRDPWTIP